MVSQLPLCLCFILYSLIKKSKNIHKKTVVIFFKRCVDETGDKNPKLAVKKLLSSFLSFFAQRSTYLTPLSRIHAHKKTVFEHIKGTSVERQNLNEWKKVTRDSSSSLTKVNVLLPDYSSCKWKQEKCTNE